MASRNPGKKTISEKGTMCLLTIRENVLYKSRTRHEQRASVYQIQIKLFIIIVMNTTSIAAGAAVLAFHLSFIRSGAVVTRHNA